MFLVIIWFAMSAAITFMAGLEALDERGSDRQILSCIALLSWLWPLAAIAWAVYAVVWLIASAMGIDTDRWWG